MADSLIPIEDPNQAVVGSGTPPVIAPGYTFGSVTDKISAIVLTRKTPVGWWVGFLLAFALANLLHGLDRLPVREGRRHLGREHPSRLGLRDRQFRLVDRHRPRRHADFRDPAAAQTDVADLDQPLRRSDDAVRGRLRGLVPAPAPRASVARVLAVPVSEHDDALAAVPQPADVGRLCGLDLCDRLAAVLVRRPGSRPGDAARSLAIARGPR